MKITRYQLRRLIKEAEGSTKKYDEDSALKGDQSKLPDGLQKGIIDKTVEDREEREEEEREEKNESLRITRRQLRIIVRESLLKEEMLKIMDNPYEDLSTYNRIANYALTNDIAGAMADPEVNTDELYWEIDEMRPWVNRVGDDSDDWFADDAVVPDGWDADAVYEFMGDLENAWHDDQAQKNAAAIAADPDKDWLEFMGDAWTSEITPSDLETLGWKEYKRYIRLSPPHSISHGVGEIHIINDDFSSGHSPGTREEFVEFLTKRAGKTLKKRKIYRSPPPLYD